MCGIVGIYHLEGAAIDLQAMRQAVTVLRHRGPDDEGYLLINTQTKQVFSVGGEDTDPRLNLPPLHHHLGQSYDLALGFRRLSILDLSSQGHQPMVSEDGSLGVVHNGEIYNYLEIRKGLETLGHRFESQTDTEVILHAYKEWGTGCQGFLNGMWAFAIVDLQGNRIFCSRDRAGVKPFYYFYDGKRFCFASEIKALLRMENFSIEPNEQIIADYLFSGLIDHTQETFFKNIYQLRPGEYLLLDGQRLQVKSYWDLDGTENRSVKESEYPERFYELLNDSIRLRLRSDVPIGSCLSGGLDSSSIVCLANKLIFDGKHIDPKLVGERQKTFSSCFEDLTYDERKYIELVIGRTGAEKNYVFPKAENLSKDLSTLIWHQEEPFGSTSIYAQWKVMQLARERGVKVLLDGQGGDELLAGYLPSFYFVLIEALKRMDLKLLFRETRGFYKSHNKVLDLIPRMLWTVIPKHLRPLFPKLNRGRMGWGEVGFRKRYFRTFPRTAKFTSDLNDYLYTIFRSHILPGLLHYEDRNSMAFSLETRLPFLDYRLVEFVFSLPAEQKIRDGTTKVILRNSMKGVLPEGVRNRMDKMGFVTPEATWFRTIFKKNVEKIIGSKSFAERGYFDGTQVKKAFDAHCRGKVNISFNIWRWVNLELWFRIFLDQKPWSENWKNDGDL